MASFLNNPEAELDFTVDISLEQPLLHESLKQVVRLIVPAWSEVKSEQTEIIQLGGGITNMLFLVSPLVSSQVPRVIVRLFGLGTDLIIDRAKENKVFASLSESGKGFPTFYGLFKNGRVEGFINHVRPLLPEEMGTMAFVPGISESLAEMHALAMESIPKSRSLFEKIDRFFSLAKAVSFPTDVSKHELLESLSLSIVESEYGWYRSYLLEKESSVRSQVESESEEGEGGGGSRESLFRSLGRLFAFEDCFCHNDYHSGNILVPIHFNTPLSSPSASSSSSPFSPNLSSLPDFPRPENVGSTYIIVDYPSTTSSLSSSLLFSSVSSSSSSSSLIPLPFSIIDYEYASYNPRSYDLANHFNEYSGLSFDEFELFFPKKDSRMNFEKFYLSRLIQIHLSQQHETQKQTRFQSFTFSTFSSSSSLSRYLSFSPSHQQEEEWFLQGFDEVILDLSLAPNLLWTLWSVIQSSSSSIDFDYLSYGIKRMNSYYHLKHEISSSSYFI